MGLTRASEILTNANEDENLDELAGATSLKKSELQVLVRGLQSALNIKLVTRFRWQSSMNPINVAQAAQLDVSNGRSVEEKLEIKTIEEDLKESLPERL